MSGLQHPSGRFSGVMFLVECQDEACSGAGPGLHTYIHMTRSQNFQGREEADSYTTRFIRETSFKQIFHARIIDPASIVFNADQVRRVCRPSNQLQLALPWIHSFTIKIKNV